MNTENKTKLLASVISENLTPVIDNDYLLLDVPYYTNVGDTLIWQGTLDFLRQLPYRCLGTTNATGKIDFRISEKTVILLQGGGNFGDLWVLHQNFRKQIIEKYPDNPIIILPQSICWENNENQEKDAAFFSNYPNVTICVRDTKSLDILKKYYPCNGHLLLPDMAFCMDIGAYNKKEEIAGTSLFVKREDKELACEDSFSVVPKNALVSDWLSIGSPFLEKWKERFERYSQKVDNVFNTSIRYKVTDVFWQRFLRKSQVQYAVDFLAPYEHIYTTRMHAAILSVILGKKDITLFDNSYGKLSSFVDTWLADVDGLKVYKK